MYNLFSGFQFAYRLSNSTENALLKVVNDLLSALYVGKFSVLVFLDLSAAFDTIDLCDERIICTRTNLGLLYWVRKIILIISIFIALMGYYRVY